MESWRKVWREAVVSLLSRRALESLKKGLEEDDPALIQRATTDPPPLAVCADWDVGGACLLGYCGWRGEGLETVGEVEEFFARICYEIDKRLGEASGCRHLLNWFDETLRPEMRRELLAEVNLALEGREA